MTDRRPSLIDQMALAAALEADIEFSSGGEDEEDLNDELDDDDIEDPSDQLPVMVFNSHLPDEAPQDEISSNTIVAARRRSGSQRHHHLHHYHVGDVSPHAGSEELDAFTDQQLIPLNWRPLSQDTGSGEASLDGSQVSSFNMSSSSEVWDDEAGVSFDMRARRPSFRQQQQLRRSSFQSLQSGDGSLHSAPARTGNDSPSAGLYGVAMGGETGMAVKRRSSYSIRRPSVNIPTFGTGGGLSTDDETNGSVNTVTSGPPGGGSSTSSGPGGSVSSGSMMRFGRFSRANAGRTTMKSSSPTPGSLDQALESLSTHNSNSEWENVAAAVTVVAAGSQGAGNSVSRHIKFAVDDTVLVLLTLLNVTNMEDPKDAFTVAPVNKYGFPQGEGGTEDEKAGPYTYVLATVKHVHFDEDDRYYTVQRADTGSEQRADSGWIEPIRDPGGIEAASRAAARTVRSAQSLPVEELEETGLFKDVWGNVTDTLSWPADFTRSKLLPWYRRQRANAKQTVTHLVYGDSPFACKVRITGINFLVFCSITFLFLEVVNLGFLPATYDKEVAIVGVIIWSILVLELIFEVLIRPVNYMELVESDRAFAPSTARHINYFHLFFEAIALITFIPEFQCLYNFDGCSKTFSRVKAATDAVSGESSLVSLWGRLLIGVTALRLFGLVRHWKQMFISNTFRPTKRPGIEKWLIPGENNLLDSVMVNTRRRKKNEDEQDSAIHYNDDHETSLTSSEEDQRLKNAATIGTALMVINSQRALVLLTSIVLVLPLLQSLAPQNHVAQNLVELLQAHNVNASSASLDDCDFLNATVHSWLNVAALAQPDLARLGTTNDDFVLWAQVLPVRCDFQRSDGVITFCEGSGGFNDAADICSVWDDLRPESPDMATEEYFASELDVREGGIAVKSLSEVLNKSSSDVFSTTVIYNQNASVTLTNMGNFFLLLGVLLVGLYGLTALRGEAIRLVLDPLQRMLKIVLRYAENPLSQDVKSGSDKNEDGDSAMDVEAEEIGNYETEQLINAITKIADLLRKCWGVAGAGIISSNLARTKDGKTVVFNPTVPGKRVYALFGFVSINGFSEQLRALNQDVMILINDVAKVVHDEVYRWALGDHGQCNKNLGSSFLMVFRIGDFSEVQKKKQVATEKLFNPKDRKSYLRRRYTNRFNKDRPKTGRKPGRNQDMDGQLMLASLPGIQPFTDRALLGMLKSFAGVHRDKSLKRWKEDFRLTAGVSAYTVDIIYGMDAGWAVEGAVGSEYKIDATYLSPHVNMASRMMSASKQYDVTILLSKAVQELLSPTCRKQLRHLDTVYVKGSNVKQEIFTFDARHRGVDFFLLERTAEQADYDAESYTPEIWEIDRDLLAMRQHVSEKFMEVYRLGVQKYLAGKWEEAYKTLQRADDIMMETVLEDGYLEYDLEEIEGRIFDKNDNSEDIVRVRHELGDGACRVLMTYMERRQLKAPDDWDAVRKLSSK